jgi:P4 family phage/plasmid primase-like protien
MLDNSAPYVPVVSTGWDMTVPMAHRFAAEKLGSSFRHVDGIGWVRFDGVKWSRCPEDRLWQAAREWIDSTLATLEAAGTDPDTMARWTRYRDIGKVKSLVESLRATAGLLADVDEFDAHPWLLNTPSGTVNLKDGVLREHRATDMLARVTRVEYEPGFTHPDWTAALKAVPADALDFLRRRMGQALTGFPTPTDQLVLAFGSGSNGKTTIFETCLAALGMGADFGGGYGRMATYRTFAGHLNNHSTETMDLMGARFTLLEELPEGQSLDLTKLKRVLGTDFITARRMRRDPVTFPNVTTILIAANHLPHVEETDDGTWRRLLVLLFPFRYAEEIERPTDRVLDRGLRARLLDPEGDGIKAALAWMVQGSADVAREGLGPVPESVVHVTAEWRDESDVMGQFIESELVAAEDSCVTSADLVREVNKWRDHHDHPALSARYAVPRLVQHPTMIKEGVRRAKITPYAPGAPEVSLRESVLPVKGQVRVIVGVRWK